MESEQPITEAYLRGASTYTTESWQCATWQGEGEGGNKEMAVSEGVQLLVR